MVGIRNPDGWNPESRGLESGIQRLIRNPESETPVDSVRWGDYLMHPSEEVQTFLHRDRWKRTCVILFSIVCSFCHFLLNLAWLAWMVSVLLSYSLALISVDRTFREKSK